METNSLEAAQVIEEATIPTESMAAPTPAPAPIVESKVKQNEDQRRGHRGSIGPHNIKGLFHSFQRREGRASRGVSLKAFAHKLAETGTDEERIVALDWLKNKSGALEKKQRAERQKNKGTQLAAIRQASKSAKKGK